MEPVSRRQLAREAALIALAMLAYFGIRNLTAGGAATAAANARRIVRLEDAAGLDWERGAQGLVVGRDPLVDFVNWVYIWGHWPAILASAAVLFLFRRDRYYVLRNAFFISGAIGFLFFALLPVIPPRLLDGGFVDTVTTQSHAYRALQPPGLTNQYAAFPSLHAGWNLLLGIVVFTATTSVVVRAFAVALPLAMSFAVVATANHYVVDVAAGIAIVLVALALASRLGKAPPAAIVDDRASDDGHRRSSAVRRRAPRRERARRAPRRRAARHPARRG
jgi:membrane-associated phospholipid phosphatase